MQLRFLLIQAVMGGTAMALGAAGGPVGFAAGIGLAILTRPGHAK